MDSLTQQQRELLYDQSGLRPLFNPVDIPDGDLPDPMVIDLTFDVSNYSRIYHPNTDKVRELLNEADVIVCETEALAGQVRKSMRKAKIVIAPFGYSTVKNVENPDGLGLGLLNHNPDFELNNQGMFVRRLLKNLKEHFIIYGSPIDGVDDYEIIEDFDEFAARCDILLLPSLQREISSVALPLALMMSGTVVLASNCNSGFYSLSPAAGVQMIESFHVKDWRGFIQGLESRPQRMDSLKSFNSKYARQVTGNSLSIISRLEQKLKSSAAAKEVAA